MIRDFNKESKAKASCDPPKCDTDLSGGNPNLKGYKITCITPYGLGNRTVVT